MWLAQFCSSSGFYRKNPSAAQAESNRFDPSERTVNHVNHRAPHVTLRLHSPPCPTTSTSPLSTISDHHLPSPPPTTLPTSCKPPFSQPLTTRNRNLHPHGFLTFGLPPSTSPSAPNETATFSPLYPLHLRLLLCPASTSLPCTLLPLPRVRIPFRAATAAQQPLPLTPDPLLNPSPTSKMKVSSKSGLVVCLTIWLCCFCPPTLSTHQTSAALLPSPPLVSSPLPFKPPSPPSKLLARLR